MPDTDNSGNKIIHIEESPWREERGHATGICLVKKFRVSPDSGILMM